jgi:phage terminase large subunit-like protein
VYASAPWVDRARLVREVRDPGVPWGEVQRFYFNLPSAGTLAAVDPALWAAQARKRELVAGERIALGFDGSHSQDATALVACTADGWLTRVEIIERPANVEEWRVDRSRIHRALEHVFECYDVAYLLADPWRWQDELEELAARWPERIVEFPTNSLRRMAPAVDRFRTALQEERITHDGDPGLARHVLNARLRKVGRDEDGRGRYSLEKAGPGRLIDACVASVLAYEAAALIEEEPERVPLIAFT